MRIRRLAYGFSSLVLSLSSLVVLMSPVAHAAGNTCTWTGATDTNFSTVGNWNNCGGVAPNGGDNLTFDNTSLANDVTLNNDITGLVVGSISFTGSGTKSFTVNGNAFTVNAGITDSATNAFNQIGANITLGGSQTFTSATINNVTTQTLDLGSYTLTVDSAAIYANITGSGNIIAAKTGSQIPYLGGNNTFTGTVTVNSGVELASSKNGLGDTSAGTTVNSGGSLWFNLADGDTVSEPLTLDGTGVDANTGTLNVNQCAGPCNPSANLTLAGAITLSSDITFGTVGTVTLTGALSGAHTINLLAGTSGKLINNSSNNQSNVPSGTINSPVNTVTYSDSQPAAAVDIPSGNVVIVTGARGDVSVHGGTLKGNGTVGVITMSSGAVAPGQSPGVLNSGNLVFTGGSLQEEIGGTGAGEYDQLNVTGTVDLGSATALNVSQWSSYVPANGDTFTIIKNDGSDAVTGTFQGLAEGATVTSTNGVSYTISYKGGDGNDVVLTAVATTNATTPDTGFEHLTNNPLATLIATFAIVAVVSLIARRQLKNNK